MYNSIKKENYKKCPICKHIFLNNHIQGHYTLCYKNHQNAIKKEKLRNDINENKMSYIEQQNLLLKKNTNTEKEEYIKIQKEILRQELEKRKEIQQLELNKYRERERQQLQRQELQRQELQKQELQRQELQRQELQRQELQRQELHRQKQQLNKQQLNKQELQIKEKNIDNEPENTAPETKEISYAEKIYLEKEFIQKKSQELQKYVPRSLITHNEQILLYFFNKYEELFANYITDKCIAIVGPAESIIGTNKGHVIDKFDLVVRLNKALPLPQNLKNDIGSRTDIVYNSLNVQDYPGENNLSTRLYKKHDVQFVCSSYPYNHSIFKQDIANYVNRYKFEIPFKIMNDRKFKNFERYLGTRPYTGTCAIMELLSYPIKYLYITGLDFYQTKYYSEYRRASKEQIRHSRNSVVHQCMPQLDYLKNISLFDNRIILDNFLDNLLYQDYYFFLNQIKNFNSDNVYNFGDPFFQQYFQLKISNCTFTNNNITNNNETNLIFTNNKNLYKNNNDYCIIVSNNKKELEYLNSISKLEKKKFIGNFYFKETNQNASIYLSLYFLSYIKNILSKINITNCNSYLIILFSIIIYLPDKHYFNYNEVLNSWNLSKNEKKIVLFLSKKNIINLI